ncbi:MAG: PorV/PorQ family protein [bacterium]|nr:MAG: PorV/PorQ family protein [bacterium]
MTHITGNKKRITNLIGISILIAALPLSQPVSAQEGPGATGATYLNLPVGSHSISMGEISSALPDDPFHWLSNPGAPLKSAGSGIGVFHSQWAVDTYYDNIFYRDQLINLVTLGIGLTYMGTPDIQGYNDIGDPTGELKHNSFQTIIGIGFTPIESVSAGVNFKFFQEKIADVAARGFGADIGVMCSLPFPEISVGAVVQNLGPNVTFLSNEEELPLTYRLGGSYRFPSITNVIGITIAAEIVRPKHEQTYGAFGGEVSIRDIFSLRAGFTGEKDRASDGLTVGGGVRVLERLTIDYAWTPYGDLGNFHRISLFYSLGE